MANSSLLTGIAAGIPLINDTGKRGPKPGIGNAPKANGPIKTPIPSSARTVGNLRNLAVISPANFAAAIITESWIRRVITIWLESPPPELKTPNIGTVSNKLIFIFVFRMWYRTSFYAGGIISLPAIC